MLTKVKAHLDKGDPARTLELDDNEEMQLRELHLITAKPVMYIANVDEDGDGWGDVSLRVEGDLIARGTPGEPIRFTSASAPAEPGGDSDGCPRGASASEPSRAPRSSGA